jgi:hypothetical protein
MRRLVSTLIAVACLLAVVACKAPSDPLPSENMPCKHFEPMGLISLPSNFAGIVPTHAVRFDIYRCVGVEWQSVGGPAYVTVNAHATPYVPGGAVKAGANYPWPYESLSRWLPWELPIQTVPGTATSIFVTGRTSALLEAGDMISCWVVTRDGRTIPGSQSTKIANYRGDRAEVTCNAIIEP